MQHSDTLPERRAFRVGTLVLLAGVVSAVLVIGIAQVRPQPAQPTSGLAPDFTLTTFDGESFRLSDLRGKIVIINFWASWCGPCRAETTALQQVWERYRDHGVVMLGVTFADDPGDSRAFMQEHGLTYPNAADVRSELSEDLYHIQGVPETFVIDQNGDVAQFIYSAVDEPMLSALIDTLLAESSI